MTRAEVLQLYRRILQHAKRAPKDHRARAIMDARKAFRDNRDEADPAR